MTPAPTRRFDLDWLRIGAFGLLILYHIGMVFVPWEFHIKTAHPVRWVEAPMLLLNAWRLPLLFLVSGAASRFLLGKLGGAGAFVRSRTRRLLVPLAAGVALWGAPQAWVDVTVNHGYARGFAWFFAHDYFRFDHALGIILPTWNHLWFVAYLWVYTLGMAALAALRLRWQAMFDAVFAGWRVAVVPFAWLVVARLTLGWAFPQTYTLWGDWYAHAVYGFAFALGVGLAGSATAWTAIGRMWRPAAAAAIASWAVVVAAVLTHPEGFDFGPATAALAVARTVQGWGAILALLGASREFLNHDHPARATLNAAVFPAYIAHQTIIIVVEFALRPYHLPGGIEFVILLAATVAGCAAVYLAGREVAWLRPLIGLGPSAPSWRSSHAFRSTPPA